jgi:ABC-type nitrate/sulfonate/bicarbonate transport system substrate-binding protein
MYVYLSIYEGSNKEPYGRKPGIRIMKKSLRSILASGAIAVVVGGLFSLTPAVAHADTASNCIEYGAFGHTVSFTEAVDRGYFTDEGLNVCFNQVSSSQQQFASLLGGQYDIAGTTADNAVNQYVNTSPNVEIIGGMEQGSGLAVFVNTANGINSIADLAGKTVAVDAPNSGYVFATEKILQENGLQPSQYTLQVIGGSKQRLQDLEAGTYNGSPVYATILGSPFSEQAQTDPNLKEVGTLSSYVAPYQGTSLVVTDAYAKANPTAVTKFLTAMIRGSLYAENPANQSQVVADIAATNGVSTSVATSIYNDTERNFVSGENIAEAENVLGLINTIQLRQSFGGFNTSVNATQLAMPGPNNVYNDQYWNAAFMQALQQGE